MKPIIVLLLFSVYACSPDVNNSEKADRFKANQLDTVQVIKDMKIVDSVFYEEHYLSDTSSLLHEKLDTLDLTYVAYACDCPHWILTAEIKRVRKHNDSVELNKGHDYISEDPYESGYYLEPINRSFEIPSYLTGGFDNHAIFIGRVYKKKGLPKFDNFVHPSPPEGKIFKYYGYKMIKPFIVWGPEYIEDIDEDTGDTIWLNSQITIR